MKMCKWGPQHFCWEVVWQLHSPHLDGRFRLEMFNGNEKERWQGGGASVQRDQPVDWGELGRSEQGHGPHLPQVSGWIEVVQPPRTPLGVCAGIAPFNFPAMIPLWMFPMALICGNTYIMKVREEGNVQICFCSPAKGIPQPAWPLLSFWRRQVGKVLNTMFIDYYDQSTFSGCPDGVVNVIHGQHDTVNFICDHPDIRAVSFVGGDAAGKHIYERGSSNGKRVQVFGGD